MSRKRIATIALALGALTATGVGVGIAATDTNASASPYAIEGKIPKTMAMHFEIGSDGVNITGHMNVDMVHNRIDGEIDIPVALLMARLQIREVGNTMYLAAGAFSSNTEPHWMAQSLGTNLDLTGLALTMAKPKVGLLPQSFGTPKVTHDGDITRHVYNVKAQSLGLSMKGTATVELDTASEGQVVALRVTGNNAGNVAALTLTVDSYNTPMTISKPAASTVRPLNANSLQQILGSSTALKSLMQILMAQPSTSTLSSGLLSL